MTTAILETDYAPPADAAREPTVPVVYRLEGTVRPWWKSVMPPAMPADPATPRSPDPRYPRARNPHVPRSRPARSAAYR
ncbi:hypothetical protein VMT65_24390 [Nocardia sp. CDC153]|uniref:hypothetical protein n=1 Tax=Nocardia sp. CDC153 TaxID=3112167 RepID=UPI002DBDEFB3|nr:hypothetical protein [Nocardia sp. CDC153]MEC3956199.1 hypothetical protein [Nocardia sp. CDC153]